MEKNILGKNLKTGFNRLFIDKRKALCRFCKVEIRAHHADLLQHANTDKHTRNAKPSSTTHLTDIRFTLAKLN